MKSIVVLIFLLIPSPLFAENRMGTFMKEIGDAMARFLLTGTQFEHAVSKEKEEKINKFEISNSSIETNECGLLNIISQYDAQVTLKNSNSNDVYRVEVKKNKKTEVEIKRGIYIASIDFNGKIKKTTVSFLGREGLFEIK